MPKEVIRWKCKHECCRKTYSRASSAVKHEDHCIHNPEQRACPSCLSDYDECLLGERPAGKAMVRDCPVWAPKYSD